MVYEAVVGTVLMPADPRMLRVEQNRQHGIILVSERRPVNMTPDYVYRCPYIEGDFGNGVIRIQYRGVSQTVDFNDNVAEITSSL
jgi:hypothetical protein